MADISDQACHGRLVLPIVYRERSYKYLQYILGPRHISICELHLFISPNNGYG